MRLLQFGPMVLFAALAAIVPASAHAGIYLNDSLITVAVGPGTSSGSFHNTFSGGQTINKVIDAPSATALEFHNQTTHIWFPADTLGGGLELLFDFGQEYDITDLHFWNYTSEGFDVDNIDFVFFDQFGSNVGSLTVQPALGSPGGIAAQDLPLLAPLNVKTVSAFLTGTNRQVDFQNIGFTADVSTPRAVPEPTSFAAWAIIAGTGFVVRRRRRH